MRRTLLSLVVGVVTIVGALMFAPQAAQAEYGYRGRGFGYPSGIYRPYTWGHRPYYYDYYRRDYYRPYIYVPPTVSPSPYGFPGMIGPRPMTVNPGGYYRF